MLYKRKNGAKVSWEHSGDSLTDSGKKFLFSLLWGTFYLENWKFFFATFCCLTSTSLFPNDSLWFSSKIVGWDDVRRFCSRIMWLDNSIDFFKELCGETILIDFVQELCGRFSSILFRSWVVGRFSSILFRNYLVGHFSWTQPLVGQFPHILFDNDFHELNGGNIFIDLPQ